MAKPTLDLRLDSTNKTEKTEETPETNTRAGGQLSHGQIYLEWEAPEYVVYKKTTVWYIGFGILLALLLFVAFVMQSFLTGIIFFLSGVLIFFHSERPPKIVSYDLRTTGIRIDSRIYLYRELSAFNIVEHGASIYLLLKSKRLLMPLIHIPLADDINHEEVLDAISNHLPQDPDFVEPLADVLAHWLGF
ncbi:MAG: hypothetical protein Q7S57_05410 [bacterium]|nr:hypothetical protein [bacterium]